MPTASRVDRLAWLEAVASEHGPGNPQTRHVLMTLALFMRKDGSGAWPSQETLAKRTGLSVRTVRRCLAAADLDSWLQRTVDRRDHGQNWKVTRYVATVPGAFPRDQLHAGGPDRESAPSQGEDSVTSPQAKVRTGEVEGAVRGGQKVRTVWPPIPLKKSLLINPLDKSASAGVTESPAPRPGIPSLRPKPTKQLDTPEAREARIRAAIKAMPKADAEAIAATVAGATLEDVGRVRASLASGAP